MPELPADFDLKLMPDWLKEPATKNPYADYEGRDDDRRSRGGSDWGRGQDDRRGRPGGQRPGGPPRGNTGGPRRDDRRRDAAPGKRPDGKRPDRSAGRPEDRRGKPGERPRADGPRTQGAQEPQGPVGQPANVTIEFFPDEGCAVSIARQIKSTHRAYSLFDLARMFLARPERHRLKITTKSVAEPLHQTGEDGPVWLDKSEAERAAFPILRQKYYEEVVEQRDAPKGNFSNVARCRANGILLGPTNYHGYQLALRKLYEERFSRRMSFGEFQREIEVVNDPALVEQWKQQASSAMVYRLKRQEAAKAAVEEAKEDPTPVAVETPVVEAPAEEGATGERAPLEEAVESVEAQEPQATAEVPYEGPVFASIQEVEQHFRENYLPGLVRTGPAFHIAGEASRSISDRGIAASVRQGWEQERGFPGQMMHQLRQQFSRSGLHVFKHRKRMQFVSLIRPSPMENGSLSPSVAQILEVIQGDHRCNRASLAAAILGTDESAVDAARRSTLVTDLRWLIETGRVIEFSDGRLELPVAPVKQETPAPKGTVEAVPAETAAVPEREHGGVEAAAAAEVAAEVAAKPVVEAVAAETVAEDSAPMEEVGAIEPMTDEAPTEVQPPG